MVIYMSEGEFEKQIVYLVECTPHGDYYDFIGIFSSKEKAKEAIEQYLKKHPSFRGSAAFEPDYQEVEIDKYYGSEEEY